MLKLFGIRRHQLSGFVHFEIEHLAIERNRALIRFFQHIDATQKVLLPEPDEPMILITSPAFAVKDTRAALRCLHSVCEYR